MATVKDLLREGNVALRLGERERAGSIFREAIEQDPDNVEGWLGLAGAVSSLDEKRIYFEQVLSLDPDNAEAKSGLQRLAQLTGQQEPAEAEDHSLFCANHPTRETLLRCNRCNKPICMECAVRTPVGFRCRKCVNEQRRVFFTGTRADYPIAAAVGFVVAGITSLLFYILGGAFGFFGFFIAFLIGPAVGGSVAGIIHSAVGRRRSPHLGWVATISVALGAILSPGLAGITLAIARGAPASTLLAAPFAALVRLDLLLFVALAVATVYARLR